MNPAVLGFGVATYSIKKMIAVVLISMMLILSLPVLVVASEKEHPLITTNPAELYS